MNLVAALFELSKPAHLPVLRDSNGDATESFGTCLTSDFNADVRRLIPARVSVPAEFLQSLTDLVHEVRQPQVFVLLVHSYLTVFERGPERICSLALRDSVRGRPAGMLPVSRLASALRALLPATRIVFCADVELLPTRSQGRPPPAAEAAELLTDALLAGVPDIDAIVRVTSPERRDQRSASAPLARALESALRFAAAGGTTLTCGDLIEQGMTYLATSDDVVRGTRIEAPAVLAPRFSFERLPGYVRDDLYSPDPGSRLDAAAELAALARRGNEFAVSSLDLLGRTDPSSQVRGYVQTLLRQDGRPTVDQLVDFGLIPSDLCTEQLSGWSLPEFTQPLGGSGTLGVDPPEGQAFEYPAHSIDVRPFRMALRPVANRDYLAFVLADGAPCPEHWDSEWVLRRELDHPVVMVSWYDAQRYCGWMTRSARQHGLLGPGEAVTLPTEAQWEFAARNGCADRHPWGSEFDPQRCNVRATGVGRILPIGSFSPGGDSAAGCVDLIGNTWDWTATAWGMSSRLPQFGYPYEADDGREELDLPAEVRRIVRGGAYYYADLCANSYTRNRALPTDRHPAGGFRITITTGR